MELIRKYVAALNATIEAHDKLVELGELIKLYDGSIPESLKELRNSQIKQIKSLSSALAERTGGLK